MTHILANKLNIQQEIRDRRIRYEQDAHLRSLESEAKKKMEPDFHITITGLDNFERFVNVIRGNPNNDKQEVELTKKLNESSKSLGEAIDKVSSEKGSE